MKGITKRVLALVLTVMLIIPCFGTALAASPLELPDLISDNMLIQRDMPIKLWGYGGTPGDTLTVQIEDKKGVAVSEGTTTIGDSGFNIELPALAAGGPYTIRFLNDKDDKLASVYNVLVGDLWYQGGQSNMQATIPRGQTDVPERVIPNPKDDTIRVFYNGEHISSDVPATDIKGKWIVADKELYDYSAVGYKALETIHNALDIPVGGICTPYGGTTLSNFNNAESGIYKAKVAPVTQFNIKGVMWYQGGTDCKNGRTAEEIENGYKQLVSLLREKWNNKNLPFMVVQLHQSKMRGLKYGSTTDYSITDHSPARIAQSNLYMSDENVGMAVTMDLSLQKYKDKGEDPDHPWIKAPVGERLGNAALEMVYGKDVKSKSPVYTGCSIDGNSVKITVQDAYDGLKTSDGKEPWGFRVAGEDGVYFDAKASLSGNTITLTSDKVSNPVSASYGVEKHIWPYTDLKGEEDIANAPELPAFLVNVVNSEGLPLGTFDTGRSIAYVTGEAQTPSEEPKEESSFVPVTVKPVEQSGDRTILYVATNGSDKNSGTIDSPFATIAKARDTIRSLKKAGTLGEGGAVVYVRGGTYTLTSGVEFTAEDSGTEDAPIIYRNYPDEEVEFVGGASIPWDAFKKVTDESVLGRVAEKKGKENLYEVDLFALGFKELPEPLWPGPYSYWETVRDYLKENGITQPQGIASELIINGEAMTIARYPNDDYLTITEVVEPGSNTEPFTPFTIGINDNRVKYWETAEDALLTGTWQYSWGQSTTQLGKVEPSKNRITAKYATHHKATMDQLFHIYNLLEEIDIPGEYYVDRKAGKLYLYPPEEEPETIMYTMLSDTMFTFKGTSYITLKGIDMKYMRFNAFNMQSDSSNNTLQDCEITYTGNISYMRGKNNLIVDCWFHDVEGGVEVGGGDSATLTHANNVVENSVFERSDRLTKTYCDAIAIGGVGNIARHNYMAEAQHLLARMSGQENTYEFNEFADACTNTDDMGALYTGRNLTHRGNKIQFNYFHDVGGANRGSNGVHGIFLDDWWSAADVVGNVFADITGAGCMAAGRHNVFSNNIFINCSESLRLTRSYDYGNPLNSQVYIDGVNNAPYVYNDLWLSKYPDMKDVIKEDGQPDMDSNIVATNNVLVNSADVATSEQIAKTATVEGNVSFGKDPGFYDMLNKNYLLKPDSEVYNRIPEFIEIPFTRIGTYSDRALARIKKAYVYCLESPYVYKNGERLKEDKNPLIVENGMVYMPLRTGAEAIGATVDFNEETYEVTVATGAKALTFTSNGSLNTVKVNGTDYALESPIVNKSYTNYIALTDLVNMFEKHLVQKDGISVISDIEGLFTEEADDGLIRYIEAQLTVY